MSFAVLVALSVSQVFADLKVDAELVTKPGWMSGGWGSYKLSVKNAMLEQPITVGSWEAHWEVKGQKVGDAWKTTVNKQVEAGGTWSASEVGYLPPDVVARAKPEAPVMVGKVYVSYERNPASRLFTGVRRELTFRLRVPAATLPEKLKLIKGKTLGIELMESRFKNFPSASRTLKWLDEAYQAMIDLTGYHPYGGKLMVIQEAPEHPYWAYAGNPVVMNTKFVPETIEALNKGVMPFGWVHEVGHNFDDVYGKWYIWNGPSAEMQANFKLAYALEVVEKQNTGASAFVVKRGGFSGPSYPSVDKEELMAGRQFVDAFFTLHGDAYLADAPRKWDSMTSDEIHSFLQRLQVAYGWEPFRRLYRWYRLLENQGLKPPESSEGKVQLMAAILCLETKVDLVPIFQRWRMPVTREDVGAMKAKYAINK